MQGKYWALTLAFRVGVWLFGCLVVLFQFSLILWDMVSLCSPGSPITHSVDQAGTELRDLPVSAFQVLRLKICTTIDSYYVP